MQQRENSMGAMHMTGGEAVARSLVAHGVDTVFGIPGAHNLALYDALCDVPAIRHIVARHEQGAAFMADGYARTSGGIGVCLTTSGPAALNTIASLGTAFSDSVPVLCIASQIPSAGIGREKGYLHECRDQLACFRPVTKWCARADTVESIPALLRDAFEQSRRDRPRPVAVEIPCDVLDASGDMAIPAPATLARKQPPAAEIARAAELLRSARRPVIWAGGGVLTSEAWNDLQRLAEHLRAPVFTTVLGKDAIAGDHPLAAGCCILHSIGREYIDSCDAMLAIGTRFTEEETDRWTLRLPQSLIHIDVDPEELGRNYEPTVAIAGDARVSLAAIAARLGDTADDDVDRASEIVATHDRSREVADLGQRIALDLRARAPDGVQLVETLRAMLPRESIVVSDLTVAAYWCRRLLDLYEPRTNVYPWGFCTLGFGLPAALGAKAARPDRPVVLLSGDGGFLFNCQELAVAVQSNLPLTVLIFNDNAYGVLRRQQEVLYGRTHAAELVNPDFVALARAFGVDARRVASLEELGEAVSEAVTAARTTVIEAVMPIPWQAMDPSAQVFAPSGTETTRH